MDLISSIARELPTTAWCLFEVSEEVMFQQTFIDGSRRDAKPFTLALSFVLEALLLALLMLVPLIYTAGLPAAQLRKLLIAPLPPRARVLKPTDAPRVPVKAQARLFNTSTLIAPRVIPRQVTSIDASSVAPGIEIAGMETGSSNSAAGRLPGIDNSLPGAAAPPAIAKPKTTESPTLHRIGGVVAEANLIRRVQPAYPALAKSARVQGEVEFSAIISKEGLIEHLQLVHGHPLLVNPAREAVLQWKYRPTLLNGQPVEVVTDIIVRFSLSQ